MQVFHLSKFYKPYSGGLETVVTDIAEATSDYDVHVLASDSLGLKKNEKIKGINVIRSKEYLNIASTSIAPGYITDVIKHCSGHILHVHLPNPMANIALYCAFLCGRDISNIIIHWHSDIVKQQGLLKLYKPFQTWLLNKAKKIIVTSEYYLNASKPLEAYKDKCVITPIGIESIASKVQPQKVNEIQKQYGGRKIIFSLGRHIYYKGFEYLIESAKTIDNAVFLIGGKGPDTKIYEKLISKHKLENKVFLIGRIEDEDLPSYYAAAYIYALPSIEKSEAFGVVQLEAMSVGTPIVATNIVGSGVPWVNQHMSSGLNCKPKSVVDLSETLNKLLKDEILREKLSKGAKSRFNKLFRKDIMITSINSTYKETVK